MESNIVKLTDLSNVHYASSNRRYPSWLAADLTQQEISKLIPMAQQIATDSSPRTQFLVGNFPSERLEGLFSSEGLGYLPPDKVKRYFIGELNQEFEGMLFHQVVIDFKDSWQGNRIGEYRYWRPYDFHVRDKRIEKFPGIRAREYDQDASGYDILRGPVFLDDKPATEYIVEDRAGIFVPIAQKWIETLILEGRQSAENIGNFNPDVFVWPKLKKAEKLAKATGNDGLVQLVNAAMGHADSLVAGGPDRHKEALRQGSIYTGTPRYKVELSGDLPQSWQSGMVEYDSLDYHIGEGRGEEGVDSKLFPYSLESLSTKAVVELMKHFASKGFNLDYIQEHMKIARIG